MRLALFSLAALALLWVGAVFWAGQRAARAEALHPPEGQFVEVDGRLVHYTVKGAGPDLVLLHGAFGSQADFTFDLVDRLAQDYRVTAFDRPGAGYSAALHGGHFSSRGASPVEQARHLAKAASALGVTRPIVLGHSFGGAVALAWALEEDAAAVVSVAGVALPWPDGLDWIYRINGSALGGLLVAPVLSALVPDARIRAGVEGAFPPNTMPVGYADHIGTYMAVRLTALRATTRQVRGLWAHIVRQSARYDKLGLPIELLHGDADISVPLTIHSGPLSERVPSAHLTVLEGAGHMPHHADPKAVVAGVHRAAQRAGLR
jgi:pimeloyl-ACP methyl ester carboxylesterase